MFFIDISGNDRLEIEHLVLDFNGTIAFDGQLIPGVGELVNRLSEKIFVHVITADTFGSVIKSLSGVKCKIHIIQEGNQDKAKLEYVLSLGAGKTAAIGNGKNDALMLESSALGICVILNEGAFTGTLMKSDIVCTDIIDALSLFEKPLRLKATLRT